LRGGLRAPCILVKSVRCETLMSEDTARQGGVAFGVYMQEVARVSSRLSREEETRLAAALRKGREAAARLESGEDSEPLRSLVGEGRKAEHRLAEAHLPLVVRVAQHMFERNRNARVSLEDLVLAGNEGLLEGLRRYDPSRGCRVSTYAVYWIRNKMSEEVRFHRWRIRIPDHVYCQLLRIMSAYTQLFPVLGHEPSQEELAGDLEIGVDELQSFLACWGAEDMVSLDRRVGKDGATTLGDLLADPREPHYALGETAVTEPAEVDSLRKAVAGALASLPERDRTLLVMRYGLEDDEPRTYEQMGRKLGISRERARQLEIRALRKLRHPSRSKVLRGLAQ